MATALEYPTATFRQSDLMPIRVGVSVGGTPPKSSELKLVMRVPPQIQSDPSGDTIAALPTVLEI
jgi:hypothetical protein